MLKQAAIYDPYLDTLGGGERYCLTVAEVLLKNGFKVDLFWSGNSKIIEAAEKRFSLDLKDIKIVPDIFGIKLEKIDLIEEKQLIKQFINHTINPFVIKKKFRKFFKKINLTRKYDVLFYLSDGSLPFLFSKKNLLHIQVPFVNDIDFKENYLNSLKLKFVSKVVCNSKFTSKFQTTIPKEKLSVVYPPVDIEKFSVSKNKDKTILSVGRFDNILNAKKQDVLIDAFKEMCNQGISHGWKLILAGGSLAESSKNLYLSCLKENAKGYPIEFVINPEFKYLKDLYSQSSIYWHAAGFNVDEDKHPEYTEHFGITIVEAMASGLVPVVVSKGGIPEIINSGVNGFLWNSPEELILQTKNLIENPDLLKKISAQVLDSCQEYSKENFEKSLLKIINN